MKTAALKNTIAIIAAVMLTLMFLTPIITVSTEISTPYPFDIGIIDVFAATYSQLYLLIHSFSMFSIPLIGFKLVLVSLIMFGLFVGFAGTAYFGFRTKTKAKVPALFGIISGTVFLITVLACSLAYSKFANIIGEALALKFGWGMYLMLSAALAIIILSIIQLVKGEPEVIIELPSPLSPPPPPPLDPHIDLDHAQIVGIAGRFRDVKFDVSDGVPVKFGRDAGRCQVVFDQFDTEISREHCTVTYLPNLNSYRICDDNSKNGVFIDNLTNRMHARSEKTVRRGTVVYLGSEKQAFRLD